MRVSKSDPAQAIVEYALTLPAVLALLLLGIEGAWVLISYAQLCHQCNQASIALAHGQNPVPLIRSPDVDVFAYTLVLTDGVVYEYDCWQVLDTPELQQTCMGIGELLSELDNPQTASLAVVDCHRNHKALTGFFGSVVYLRHGGVSAR